MVGTGVKMGQFGCVSGIDNALKMLNSFPRPILTEMCHHVLLFLQYKISSLCVGQYRKKLESSAVISKEGDVSDAMNAVCHLYRCSVMCNWDDVTLRNDLEALGYLTKEVVDTLSQCWSEQKHVVATDELKGLLSVGKLVDIDWKASMATGSSSCRGLHAVFITVSLRILDSGGHVLTKAFVLSMKEFKEFSSQIKEIKSTLESV